MSTPAPAVKTASLPRGTVKLKTAALLVPLLVTVAFVPAAPVVVLPMDMVAALPVAP
jgi:hypothetical protein